MERLDRTFFEQHTAEVAEYLIGCLLIRQIGGQTVIARITETEAYRGADDPASHAYRGMTPRNAPMFHEAGRLYVYLSYGIHHCINIVTERNGSAGAVLLRAAIPAQGIEVCRANRPGVTDKLLMNGPGKLAKALGVDLSMNGYDMLQTGSIFAVADRTFVPPIGHSQRIGISKGKELPWRFSEVL
jgi:DNA-3-methyladenine glycosylase